MYTKTIKGDLSRLLKGVAPFGSLCTILFGPFDRTTDVTVKASPLLSTKSNGEKNIVVNSLQDILANRSSSRDPSVRLQVFQIYKDEVMDLLVQDYNQLSEKVIVKKAGISGRVDVLSNTRHIRGISDIIT